MRFKRVSTLILTFILSSQGFGAGFSFFNLFRAKKGPDVTFGNTDKYGDQRFNFRDPNCSYGYPTWQRNTNRAARETKEIQYFLSNGQRVSSSVGASTADLLNKAMAQVSCPTRNIGAGSAGCSSNGYRSSSYDCAFYVRKALRGTVLPPGDGLGDAKDMGCNLQKYGMRNLCQNGCGAGSSTCRLNPYSAPLGAVLIYANVGSSCHPAGHAEIRTDKGFVSDYFSTRPRNEGSSCRRLIGIWVKGS